MRVDEVVLDKDPQRAAWQREGIERVNARVTQAKRLLAQLISVANAVKRTKVRTTRESEAMGYLMFRLHQSIYMAQLIKHALIGL